MVKYVKKKRGRYVPSRAMRKIAVIDESVYDEAAKSPIKFWGKRARNIHWFTPPKSTYKEKLPFFQWFVGGKTNLSYNCLDKHLFAHPEKAAIKFIPENPKKKPVVLSYRELTEKVCQLANFLKKQGVKKGDVVAIYMPMIPEALAAMLACTRIGAIHSVVFSAFSAVALQTRLKDGGAKMVITADGYYRRGKPSYLTDKVDQAIKGTRVRKVVVVQRIKKKKLTGKYIDYKQVEKQSVECAPAHMDSEDPLFILYTSGTTGKPKGVMHTTGGYTVQALHTAKYVFNINDDDIMWCTADIGWITGHTYVTYAPLLNGITTVIYEGSLDYPDFSRTWQVIEDHKVTILYTAPTAIRMYKTHGTGFLKKHKLASLRVLGSVGEPIDESTWRWYFKYVGKKRCPIVDTWWQTETGGIMISSLASIGPFIPAFAARPIPGLKIGIIHENGKKVKEGESGFLTLHPPLPPGVLRSVWKNPKKYKEKYWNYKKFYFAGDGAYTDKKGYIRIIGRVDDIIKVAGHRMSTAEMEEAIHRIHEISENAVVAKPDYLKGELPVVFVKLKTSVVPSDKIKDTIVKALVKNIGPIAKPGSIHFVSDLPKTRSGKTMRRILKSLLKEEPPGELSTIVNPECIDSIKETLAKKKIV